MAPESLLIVRLGAMGDVVHSLPAAAALKRGHPGKRLIWAVHPAWRVLLAGNPSIDQVLTVNRRDWRQAWAAMRRIRAEHPVLAIDLQGLVQSSILARLSGAPRRTGFCRQQAREGLAAVLYTQPVMTQAAHVVDRNLEIAVACGGVREPVEFALPPGQAEGSLPTSPFVLTCPLAGWTSKQWPMAYYAELSQGLRKMGLTLVCNGAPSALAAFQAIPDAVIHGSSIDGLLWATRQAAAVVGVDSGPLHIAAALGKKGVAIFGPTDPARNGPYGGSIAVLRDPRAATSYKRRAEIDESMKAIRPQAVLEQLRAVL